MSLQRTPLGLLDNNRTFNHEMTPYQRGVAVGMRLSGRSNAQIQANLKISRRALRSTLTKDELRYEGKNQL